MYGLDQNIIKEIQRVFSQNNFVEEAILYGSRAKGNYRNGSDIDLVVAGKNLSTDSIYLLEEQLEALGFLYKFDVQHIATINNTALLKHIREEGILFYKKDNEDQPDEG